MRVPAAQLEVAFEAGDTIWTESSYKYRLDGLLEMLGRAGFRGVAQWAHDGFALTLAEVA